MKEQITWQPHRALSRRAELAHLDTSGQPLRHYIRWQTPTAVILARVQGLTGKFPHIRLDIVRTEPKAPTTPNGQAYTASLKLTARVALEGHKLGKYMGTGSVHFSGRCSFDSAETARLFEVIAEARQVLQLLLN